MIRTAAYFAIALVSLHVSAGFSQTTDLSGWFKSLRQPGTGMSCCDISDCQAVNARTSAEGYEVFIDGRWIAVPEDKILNGKNNPLGRAVACYTPRQGILCFVRPLES
jgi:hypothetical protein